MSLSRVCAALQGFTAHRQALAPVQCPTQKSLGKQLVNGLDLKSKPRAGLEVWFIVHKIKYFGMLRGVCVCVRVGRGSYHVDLVDVTLFCSK